MKNKSIPFEMFAKAYRVDVTALSGSYYFYAVTTVKAAPNCLEKFIDGMLNKAFIPLAVGEQEVKNPQAVIQSSRFMSAEIMADVKRGELGELYISAPITRVKEQSLPIHP